MKTWGKGLGYSFSVGAISALLLFLEWTRIDPDSLTDFAYLALVGFAVVPLAILLISTIAYLALPSRDLPRLRPEEWPRIAVLYTSFNDIQPEATALTKRNLDYPNAEVWVLSDSTNEDAIALEEALTPSVSVFRRENRRGGKAGAINDWLRQHGSEFAYVVPMDSDTFLHAGSLRTLVEIAKHPANARYGGFQSLMEVHRSSVATPFSWTLGRGVKWACRIVPVANQRLFGQAMYWGSNALLRSSVVVAAGGWVEDNICEDFALTARLDEAGYPIALVEVYNAEGFPPDALALRERSVRWAKANLSVAPSVLRKGTSLAVKLGLFLPLLFYFVAPTLLSLLLLTILAPPSEPSFRLGSVVGLGLLVFIFTYRLVAVPRDMDSLRSYATTLLVETIVVLGMSLRIAWAFVSFPLRRPSWIPSRKRSVGISWATATRESAPELAFGVLLLALLVALRPPVTYTLLASVWVASFLLSPIVLWASPRPALLKRRFAARETSASPVRSPLGHVPGQLSVDNRADAMQGPHPQREAEG